MFVMRWCPSYCRCMVRFSHQLIDSRLSLLPRLTGRTRRAWSRLARPVTLPENSAQWQAVMAGLGSQGGPFDWALSMGPLRRTNTRLTALGQLVEAWRIYGDADAQSALSQLAHGLLQRAESELGFNFRTELPSGFESGTRFTFAELTGDRPGNRVDFWDRRWASSYKVTPALPEVAESCLACQGPVGQQRVLLTTLVYDAPELASTCVHLLKSNGAAWVGLLALAADVRRG
jgi:hypothetical protein